MIVSHDSGFLDNVCTDIIHYENRKLVHAMINLAHNLNLEVVAEGVETSLQASQLRALGCTSLQGFFFARPQTATELVRWRNPVTA